MRKTAILLVLLGVLLALESSAAIAAGTYQVSACNYTPAGENHSWVWTSNDIAQPSHYTSYESCPYLHGSTGGSVDQESGLSTTDALHLSNGAPPNTSAGWTFTAPPNTTIAAITYERYLGHIFDSSNYWSPALRANGSIIDGETCLDTIENGESCFLGGPPGQGGEPATITGLAAHELNFGIRCEALPEQECVTGATLHKVWAAMYGANVTIADPTPPTLNPPSGTLWEPGADNGFHKGTETVTTSAQDIGGGVQSITLSADGEPVATYNAVCDFTLPQPCPLSTGPQTLTLVTAELGDGTHTLTLSTMDAAGNQSSVDSEQIEIDNNPPPPPNGLAAKPTQLGGTTFTVTWSEPNGQAAPITQATIQVCPSNGSAVCSPAITASAGGPAMVTVPAPGTWDIAVWLTNAAGNGTQANAAHTIVNVPANVVNNSPGGSSSEGARPATSNGPTPTPKTTLRLSEILHGRELIVHISGPASGRVRVAFTGRLGHRTVVSYARSFLLEHGHLTAKFKLGPRTAAHARIRVSAQLDHERTVVSTLHRRTAKHR